MDQYGEMIPAAAGRSRKQEELARSRLVVQRRIQERVDAMRLLQQLEERLRREISELRRDGALLEPPPSAGDHVRPPPSAAGELLPPQPESRAELLRCWQQIRLEPNSAHRRLLLSSDDRRVSMRRQDEPCAPHPDRFTYWYQALSSEGLTGRRYWEVEWRGGGGFVAVAYGDISRAGGDSECIFGFNDKSWALKCDANSYMFWHNKECRPVPGPPSSRVGVYLDHPAGILSFYSVSETTTLLHRVQTAFTQPLLAGVWLLGSSGVSAEFTEPS